MPAEKGDKQLDSQPEVDKRDLENLKKLKNKFFDAFGRLSENDGRTIQYYYMMGKMRGVDGFQYVSEAIKRASMKKTLDKPISYMASLCKNFYKNGLYAQPFQEEKDIIRYIQSRIGRLSLDNKTRIQAAISTNGAVRVMGATATVLSGFTVLEDISGKSPIETEIIDRVIQMIEVIFGTPPEERVNK